MKETEKSATQCYFGCIIASCFFRLLHIFWDILIRTIRYNNVL